MRKLSPAYTLKGFRRQLASLESVPQYALLGIASGVVTGIVMLAFRAAIEIPLVLWMGDADDFESLTTLHHLLMPVAGAIVLALLFSLLRAEHRIVGVVHVLHQLQSNQGYLGLRNALAQFAGGVIALWSGQSAGREGPAIHLGAASSSLLGQFLKLPDNSIRVLVGCGAAAAIAASFNTPIAGVIFSMEVIMLEYTISGFIPVILAATTATLINQIIYGNTPAFTVPPVAMHSFYDVPFLAFEGVIIGMLAAAFIFLVRRLHSIAPKPLWIRLLAAGSLTGVCAVAVPAIMGIGYDTVSAALLGELPIYLLLAACALKLMTTTTNVAMGLPAGLIGPTLFIGATAGGLLGAFGQWIAADVASNPAFYVMLGMGAMMGAVLQAPLGALMAVMELTHNPHIILPAMLVIVVANLTASHLFRQRSIFHNQLELTGLKYAHNPVTQVLNRTSVAGIMERNFVTLPLQGPAAEVRSLLDQAPVWVLIDDTQRSFVVSPDDVREFVNRDIEATEVDFSNIEAPRLAVSEVRLQATLKEALDRFNESGADVLCITRPAPLPRDRIAGILTRQRLDEWRSA